MLIQNTWVIVIGKIIRVKYKKKFKIEWNSDGKDNNAYYKKSDPHPYSTASNKSRTQLSNLKDEIFPKHQKLVLFPIDDKSTRNQGISLWTYLSEPGQPPWPFWKTY